MKPASLEVERLATLEAKTAEQERRLERIETKVDELLALAAAGKGLGWALVKIGAFLVALAGAAAWVAERLRV